MTFTDIATPEKTLDTESLKKGDDFVFDFENADIWVLFHSKGLHLFATVFAFTTVLKDKYSKQRPQTPEKNESSLVRKLNKIKAKTPNQKVEFLWKYMRV